MGRYDLSAQRVHNTASQLLHAKRISSPPPWYDIIATFPPSSRLDRPPFQRPQKPGKKPSKRLFQPLSLNYPEDRLRWEYYNDHPWELARPRVILEDNGRDRQTWDWSVPLDHSLDRPLAGAMSEEGARLDEAWDAVQRRVAGRPLNGEAVIQRQSYLLSTGLAHSHAYDTARKELYRMRHAQEIETRTAREEALAVGAFFGLSPLDIGMKLEDQQHEEWKEWAKKEIEAAKQLAGSAYTGLDVESAATSSGDGGPGLGNVGEPGLEEVSASVPASKQGQQAKGGAAVHP